ncbi:hypothetical protein LIER_15221 [Lithospermum erythrorhizon]|uniref:ATP-dependent DNA helicase n=1 Tax=Lithospermum erythrorhizon TaxID=34254 RepID=A0AAV3Q247_LITER
MNKNLKVDNLCGMEEVLYKVLGGINDILKSLEEDLYALNELNKKQKEAFDILFNRAMSNTGGAFFLDGPGGTGKNFLYKEVELHTQGLKYQLRQNLVINAKYPSKVVKPSL